MQHKPIWIELPAMPGRWGRCRVLGCRRLPEHGALLMILGMSGGLVAGQHNSWGSVANAKHGSTPSSVIRSKQEGLEPPAGGMRAGTKYCVATNYHRVQQ